MSRPVAPSRRDRWDPRAAGRWVALFATAVAVRAACAWLTGAWNSMPTAEAAEVDAVAWSIARGSGFSLTAEAGLHPTALVPPIAPWLVSLIFRLTGHVPAASIAFSCAIGACLPLLLAALGSRLFGGPIGVLAAWLVAFDPLLVAWSTYPGETVSGAMLMLALLATAEWIKTPRPGRALGAGLLWGLASLARPAVMLLPPTLALWAWVPLGLSVAPRDRVRQVVFLVLGLALAVGPWAFRNAITFKAFVPITSDGGLALIAGNNATIWDDPGRRGGTLGVTDLRRLGVIRGDRPEPRVDRQARASAMAFVASRPGEWPAVALARVVRMWSMTDDDETGALWRHPGSLLAGVPRWLDPVVVWSAVVMPLAFWGLVCILRGPRRWFQSLVVATMVYFTLVAVAFWGALRMRLPVEPFVLLLAAVGFDKLRRRTRVRSAGLRVVERRSG